MALTGLLPLVPAVPGPLTVEPLPLFVLPTTTVTNPVELLPEASAACTVMVYVLVLPELPLEAASVAVRLPVIWMSPGNVGWSQSIAMIFATGAGSQLSDTTAETVTGTSS